MAGWTWDRLEGAVEIKGMALRYELDDCDRVAGEIGLARLPSSYCEYVKRFGAGYWSGDLRIAVPHHPVEFMVLKHRVDGYREYVDSILRPFPGISKMLKEGWTEGFDVERLGRLLCLGDTGNGDHLCWDPYEIGERGEMPLCMVMSELDTVVECGNDLLEFLGTFWVEGKIDEVANLKPGESMGSGPVFTVIGEDAGG